MTLFHGGLVAVEDPQIMSRASYRPLDFGTGFDVVTGPVANDRVYTVILQYEAGFLTEEEAVARLKPYRLAGQVLFHTERSLSFLKKVSTAEVPR